MRRYPGTRPFSTQDRHLFQGREKEIRDLFQLMVLNDVVVLFGKSGTGKSSLLNAGVAPMLENRNLLPVFIRLNNTEYSPEQQVYQNLKENNYLPADTKEGLPLWDYFKQFWYVDTGEIYTPVIIFDQFEELFTLYSAKERDAFIKQFAAIVNGIMPELNANINPKSTNRETPPQVKFAISIRSDYLYLLDHLSGQIPGILRTRYELKPLNRQSATHAITVPAALEGDFQSPAFSYSKSAVNQILNVLSQEQNEVIINSDENISVDPFLLQLLCQSLEEYVIKQGGKDFILEPTFFGGEKGLQNIIDQFYTVAIGKLPKERQSNVEKMLATALIRNEKRIILEESIIKDEYHLDQAELDILLSYGLVRRESRKGSFYYELSHDTWIASIVEKYQQVEQLEQKQAIKDAEALAEKERSKRIEQEQLRKTADQNAKRARWLALLGFLLFAISLATSLYAFRQTKVAKNASEEAVKERDFAKEKEKEAEKEKRRAEDLQQEALSNLEQAQVNEQKAEDALIEVQNQKKLVEVNAKKIALAKLQAEEKRILAEREADLTEAQKAILLSKNKKAILNYEKQIDQIKTQYQIEINKLQTKIDSLMQNQR